VDDPLCQRGTRHLRRLDGDIASHFLVLEPALRKHLPNSGALGAALVGFNVITLVMVLIPYRRYGRWAWYTLWMSPLQWLLQFVFLPDLTYLTLAMLSTAGLVLSYRRFFSRAKKVELV
jgi:hypothetical protein